MNETTLVLSGELFASARTVQVHVGIPGDISGPILGQPDGKCDMRDISYIILHFNGKPGDPKWPPNCDINSDNVINMRE